MAVQIRGLVATDHAQALAVWQACEGIRLRDEDGPAGFAAYLERNPQLSLGCELQGRLVATLLVGHDGRRGYLQHLAVLPEFRRQGIARALLERALEALAQLGISRSHVFVLEEAPGALAFWQAQADWMMRADIRVFSCERSAAAAGEGA